MSSVPITVVELPLFLQQAAETRAVSAKFDGGDKGQESAAEHG